MNVGVKVIDTTFRDAHQSLLATRLRTEDMLPVAELMDSAGFYSMEVWGGATFDVAIRYLREDPWERVRALKSKIKRTKLQMLLRGQNLVGYRHYPDDVVEAFVGKAYEVGIDIFRVFDALNDVRNLRTAVKKAKAVGGEVQGCIAYTISPIHTIEHYLKVVDELLSLEVDVITIKDMAGIIAPKAAFELISRIKEEFKVPVNLHTHSTGGMSVAAYLEAVRAGVDFIDTAVSPLAFGTAQPGIQSVLHALPEEFRPKVNLDAVNKVSKYLRKLLEEKYYDLLNPFILLPNPDVVIHQIPGGMMSNLVAQLKQLGKLDKLDEVLEEVPRVRADLGYPPLVTPLSQIVGTQAVLNVMSGRRYAVIAKEVRDYIKGLYGRPPGKISEELREKALKGEEPIKGRPADLLKPELGKCREEVKKLGLSNPSDEDVLTYCLFPKVAPEYFKARAEGVSAPKVEKRVAQKQLKKYKVIVGGQEFIVEVQP
jgi:pyruvate carboxylase subunit B